MPLNWLTNKITLLCWTKTILMMRYLLSPSFVAFKVELLVLDVWYAHEVFFPGKLQPTLGLWLTGYIVMLIIKV